MKEDIRLLGRLLGDVLRDQEGEDVFAVVETIRQTAVRFRREADAKAGDELNTWRTSPKTSTISGAAAPTCWPARPPSKARSASR